MYDFFVLFKIWLIYKVKKGCVTNCDWWSLKYNINSGTKDFYTIRIESPNLCLKVFITMIQKPFILFPQHLIWILFYFIFLIASSH